MVSSIKVNSYNAKTPNNKDSNKQSFGKRSKERLISYKNMAATALTTFGAFGITDYFIDEFLDSNNEMKRNIKKTAKRI